MTEQDKSGRKLHERLEANKQRRVERYNYITGENLSKLGYFESSKLKEWDKQYNQSRKPTWGIYDRFILFILRFVEFYVCLFVVSLPYFFSYDWNRLPMLSGIAFILWLINTISRKKDGIYLLDFAPNIQNLKNDYLQWLEDPDKFWDMLEEKEGCPLRREYPSKKEKEARAILAS